MDIGATKNTNVEHSSRNSQELSGSLNGKPHHADARIGSPVLRKSEIDRSITNQKSANSFVLELFRGRLQDAVGSCVRDFESDCALFSRNRLSFSCWV